MPFFLDRRSFLKRTLSVAAFSTLATVGGAGAPIRAALFCDTHIAADPDDQFRGFFPHKNLRAAIRQASALSFDLFVVNEDLARQQGQPGDYAQFTSLIDPMADRVPTVITLGNHDDRKNLRSALVKRAGEIQPVEQKLVTTIDAGAFRFVLLDSLMVTNIAAGQLGHSQREWLADFLRENNTKPVIVFVHHNPDAESDGALVDADRLLAILAPAKQVKALLFGHTHVYAHEVRNGLHLLNLPAVGYNFADGNPVGWVEAAFSPGGADLKLHTVAGDTSSDADASRVPSHIDWR